MARNRYDEDEERFDSVPAGQIGGRVCVPVYRNSEGIDKAIDPEQDIYSGMLKRQARQNQGCFTKKEFEEIEPLNKT